MVTVNSGPLVGGRDFGSPHMHHVGPLREARSTHKGSRDHTLRKKEPLDSANQARSSQVLPKPAEAFGTLKILHQTN